MGLPFCAPAIVNAGRVVVDPIKASWFSISRPPLIPIGRELDRCATTRSRMALW